MASCPTNLRDCLTLNSGDPVSSQYNSISSLFNNILPNVYIAAGIIIFFMILFGGFTIITNAANSHKIQEGQKIITSAIIGLVIVFGSYWIIQIIQVITGLNILKSNL